MKIKVLWIEDGAYSEVGTQAGPVENSGSYDLAISLDASDATEKLLNNKYDIVIFDIRITPGKDGKWQRIYAEQGFDVQKAKLGLQLLYCVLGKCKSKIDIDFSNTKEWLTANMMGVLTIEDSDEIKKEIKEIGIKHYVSKKARMPSLTLLNLLNDIAHG